MAHLAPAFSAVHAHLCRLAAVPCAAGKVSIHTRVDQSGVFAVVKAGACCCWIDACGGAWQACRLGHSPCLVGEPAAGVCK